MRLVVVGGGISGLTTAYLARAAGHDAVCIDAGPRPGGLIRSERRDGFLCEAGPQAVLDGAPDTVALIAALGLDARALRAAAEARRRFIYAGGRLHLLPMSPPALLKTGLLSGRGKLRLLAEPFIPRRRRAGDDDDETVEAFGARRLGPEAGSTLLGTAIIGVYAADAAMLSLASAFPRLAAMEHERGSLFRGVWAGRKSGRGPGRPLSFPGGLAELPAALATALGKDGLSQGRVVAIEPRASGGWRVITEAIASGTASASASLDADAVVVAVAPGAARSLVGPLLPPAVSATFNQIRTAPVAVCCLGFRDTSSAAMGMDLSAYGFLVARGQPPLLLGCQYESSIFPDRAPPGGVLLRGILGGLGRGFQPDVVDRSDEQIASQAVAELGTIAGLKRQPDLVQIWRHPHGIPLPEPGHAARVAAIDAALRPHRGLFVIGHGLRGVGVNESIRTATATAFAAQAFAR